MASYQRPFSRLCESLSAHQADRGANLFPLLAAATREDCIQALANVRRDQGRCIKALFQITNGPWGCLLPPQWSRFPVITRREVGYHPPRRQRARDRFTEDEVQQLRQEAQRDPISNGLFTFFLHTGCRSGAVCGLRTEDVQNRDGTLRAVGSVEEKGGIRREFVIDSVLADALAGALALNRGSSYVFPKPMGIGRRTDSHNDQWLRHLCQRCDIHGDHVHVHALRRVPGWTNLFFLCTW